MTLFAILAAFAADVSVASFGAVADGSEKCTRAFAAAIAACEKAGGGRVVVPQGLYFTGPIHLKSDVELHLEDGAIVRHRGSVWYYIARRLDKAVIFGVERLPRIGV